MLPAASQELIAARYAPGSPIPSVTLCLPRAPRCLPRLPLVVDRSDGWWHLSLERWPHALLRTHADSAIGGGAARSRETPSATPSESASVCAVG